jgi:hypothetical protein
LLLLEAATAAAPDAPAAALAWAVAFTAVISAADRSIAAREVEARHLKFMLIFAKRDGDWARFSCKTV